MVELAWKTAKRIIGTNSQSPRMVIREMAAEGFVESTEKWFRYLDARNLSSHTYQESLAEEVYQVAKEALPEFEKLLKVFHERR